MAFLSREALVSMGFAGLGDDVMISEKASIYGASRIAIGHHVRIDDFCVLSAGAGGIAIGNYVHIAVYSCLMGGGSIVMDDFSGLSSRVAIYSSNDDYSGASMTNPMVPDAYKQVTNAPVRLGRHVIVGSGSIVLPGVTLGEGVAIGALSLVRKNCEPFGIYSGNPVRRLGARDRLLLDHEKKLLANSPMMTTSN